MIHLLFWAGAGSPQRVFAIISWIGVWLRARRSPPRPCEGQRLRSSHWQDRRRAGRAPWRRKEGSAWVRACACWVRECVCEALLKRPGPRSRLSRRMPVRLGDEPECLAPPQEMMTTVFSPAEPQARVLARSAAPRGKRDRGASGLQAKPAELAWPGRARAPARRTLFFRVPEIVRGAARSADTAARTARGRSRDRGGLSPSKARHKGAVRTNAAPMAKRAGMKTKPTQPRQAGGAVRSAAIAARASIRVKAAFSDAVPSERGKPIPNRRGDCTFQDRGEGLRWSSWRGHGERQGNVPPAGARERSRPSPRTRRAARVLE